MMDGWITDIQRFSLNDGNGIRTTVFFKGCNLRCAWCHNPETLTMDPSLMYYKTRCIGCGYCIKICPQNALSLGANGIVADRIKCALCGSCSRICYPQAMLMCGMKVNIEDILSEVEQDRAYYENSSGGVTLSGGEVFCQAEFTEEIVDVCLKKGISISIETNLNHPFDKIESILKKVSHIYIDIKLMDSEDHKKWTGDGNDLILQNVKKIDSMETSYTVRTPLIPEVTDTDANLTAIQEFVSTLHKIKEWELMNFNPLGAGKYENLSIKNIFRDARPLSKERLNSIFQKLKGNKVPMSIV